jgi:hypothetical protein
MILVTEGYPVREANRATFHKSSEEGEPFIAILSILYPTLFGMLLFVTVGFGCIDYIFKCFDLLYSDYLELQNSITCSAIVQSFLIICLQIQTQCL